MTKRGILLLNMGGPNTLDEVVLFLRNMFADPAILPMHPWLRKMIGNRIVKKRLHEAQENYRQLGGRSPLTEISKALAEKVEAQTGCVTLPAMRYVPPFADEALRTMQERGVEEIVCFPMYPQYSTTTTESSWQDVQEQCKAMGYAPSLHLAEPYYADPGYMDILLDRIRKASVGIDTAEYTLILSAHGLPLSIIEAGDPYRDQIEASVVAMKKALKEAGMPFASVELAYQSKVGNAAWLEPNLADLLRHPRNLKVMILPLAFTIDNSETHFELDVEHRLIADKLGYDDYRVVSCPNDGDDFAKFIAEKINVL